VSFSKQFIPLGFGYGRYLDDALEVFWYPEIMIVTIMVSVYGNGLILGVTPESSRSYRSTRRGIIPGLQFLVEIGTVVEETGNI
jgi:hypothetical protein